MRVYNRYYVTDKRTGERKVVDSTDDVDAIERWYPNSKIKAARTNAKEEPAGVDSPGPTADDLGF